ncbi:MAG: homoserine O-acetyltransferase family protein [Flavisolibacter sp.]
MNQFHYGQSINLETGEILPELTIAYHTYGKLNASKSNVVWICHALTANSDAESWWPGMIGKNAVLDTEKYFIVCANILGSCYGTTGPLSINPKTSEPYFNNFPLFTIRDMVHAHILLRKYLGIEKIYLMVGGSMGGYQALEWCFIENEIIERLFLIGSSAQESPWGIAIHTAQRLAIEADATWGTPSPSAGQKGLRSARAMALIVYRNYAVYSLKQNEETNDKINGFKAESYIKYQGEKLVNRFNAYSYYSLSKALDTHNMARDRAKTTDEVLKQLKQKTLVIGITSDLLFPLEEIKHLAEEIPGAKFQTIDSYYGHDGFLTEVEVITDHLRKWLGK